MLKDNLLTDLEGEARISVQDYAVMHRSEEQAAKIRAQHKRKNGDSSSEHPYPAPLKFINQ